MIAACMAAGAIAQVQVGPKIGMNLYKINDGEKIEEEGVSEPFAIGFNLGLATSFNVSENFAVAPELIYTQKGASTKAEDGDNYGKITSKLSFIEIPVLGRVSFGDVVKGYVNVGPSLGYWIGGSTTIKAKTNGESEKERRKLKFVSEGDQINFDEEIPIPAEEANRLEIGAVLGGGAMLNTGAGDILFDLRYQAGLTNMIDFDDDDYKFRNNGLAISVIYLLGSR